jgi:hypothetical protein
MVVGLCVGNHQFKVLGLETQLIVIPLINLYSRMTEPPMVLVILFVKAWMADSEAESLKRTMYFLITALNI